MKMSHPHQLYSPKVVLFYVTIKGEQIHLNMNRSIKLKTELSWEDFRVSFFIVFTPSPWKF